MIAIGKRCKKIVKCVSRKIWMGSSNQRNIRIGRTEIKQSTIKEEEELF